MRGPRRDQRGTRGHGPSYAPHGVIRISGRNLLDGREAVLPLPTSHLPCCSLGKMESLGRQIRKLSTPSPLLPLFSGVSLFRELLKCGPRSEAGVPGGSCSAWGPGRGRPTRTPAPPVRGGSREGRAGPGILLSLLASCGRREWPSAQAALSQEPQGPDCLVPRPPAAPGLGLESRLRDMPQLQGKAAEMSGAEKQVSLRAGIRGSEGR